MRVPFLLPPASRGRLSQGRRQGRQHGLVHQQPVRAFRLEVAASQRYRFLVDTYETEILKVLSVWATFRDEDLRFRPHPSDRRGRSVLEHMVHQSVGENLWFEKMLGIAAPRPALPETEDRRGFVERYAENASARLRALAAKPDAWWEEETAFFEVRRSRAWIVTRRIAHTAHHRGQQTALLRMLNRDLYSTYGPTADTGGLMADRAPVVYPYGDLAQILEAVGGARPPAPLPKPETRPLTERPDARQA